MPSKPILIYKLTPSQIALVDRLAGAENGLVLDDMEYREVVIWQELDKLGMVRTNPKRRKLAIVLTDLGKQIRANGYFSKKPVVRLTEPQIVALRFLAGGPRGYNEMPSHMVDVCRRLGLRGWAEWQGDIHGPRWMRITPAGWQVLKLVDNGDTSPDGPGVRLSPRRA